MSHCFQYLDRHGELMYLADLDDEICRIVLGREPDPDYFCFEFNVMSLAVSTFGYTLETLLRDVDSPIFPLSLVDDREAFAAVLTHLIRNGITTRAWRQSNH